MDSNNNKNTYHQSVFVWFSCSTIAIVINICDGQLACLLIVQNDLEKDSQSFESRKLKQDGNSLCVRIKVLYEFSTFLHYHEAKCIYG